jgi:hypothetical protein
MHRAAATRSPTIGEDGVQAENTALGTQLINLLNALITGNTGDQVDANGVGDQTVNCP